MATDAEAPRVLVLACGALARELRELIGHNRWSNVTLECLPAELHNRPKDIPAAVTARLEARRASYDRVLLGYADCGTGGDLDRLCAAAGMERLPGAHCYELFAGRTVFADLHHDEPGTFYLTDYLTRHFDRLVMGVLGIEAHPELRDAYFGHYRRVVYLAQADDPDLVERARAAAGRLGLDFEVRPTGYGDLATGVVDFVTKPERAGAARP